MDYNEYAWYQKVSEIVANIVRIVEGNQRVYGWYLVHLGLSFTRLSYFLIFSAFLSRHEQTSPPWIHY